ncbi:methyl-CpG-binding domain protein 5-like [Scleropages formosus]|uniref:Methyl-CpG-binding domain protein 5-like n=1 Tax=Scleropages formosus TaxID=113540 RepID=A0A0P7X6D3_SCLFO|nr:methyl-CpG-binding domain protein 5-like [Scleropages formosus]
MNGAQECEGRDKEGQPPAAQVPIGWRREVGPSRVVYISPSGSVLSCLEQVKTYLLTDGTCKCGLECPLILHKVFNFDPGAVVKHRTAEDARADEDVTKLCIHKRKIIAVATLHRSMEVPRPSLVLTSPGGGTSVAPAVTVRSVTPRGAIRNKLPDGPNSIPPECRNPFKAMMVGQRPYQLDQNLAQQTELHLSHPRQRLGSGEHGQRSPYRVGHSGLLSPTSSGSLTYGDGSPSPRNDTLGSPEVFTRAHAGGFHGAGSPGSAHGNHRTPLSPHGILLHGSPVSQLSCAMAGRTNVPLSPTHTAKSPVMKKPMCSFGMDAIRVGFHPPPPLPPSCALKTKQVTSEKDPLGILDPIPSKPLSQSPMVMNPPSFQPSVHPQVPVMNVNIPPAVVPLPSNLPLPTVKPGPISHGGHSQRLQHSTATSSVPLSPVTSPVHVAAPTVSRMEASPQRSRSSSTSSDHGSFAMPLGPQASCGNMKPLPRSPRSSVASPRPSMPSSPSAKPDGLHPYKELLGTVPQHGTGTGNVPPKAHPGLLGMPLNQIFSQHNSASFPASILLSAAAKAQLANQSKLTGGTNGNSAHPGSMDGHSTLPPVFTLGPALPAMTEGQSGRAALRDKLMAQQRELLRKRQQAGGDPGSTAFTMAPPEHPRATPRPTGFHPATSMAQLLQSISSQSSQLAGNGGPRASDPVHFSERAASHRHSLQGLQVPQRLQSTGNGQHCLPSTDTFQGPFLGVSGHMQVSSVAGCRPQGPDGLLGTPAPDNPGPHIQQISTSYHHQIQSHLHSRGGATPAPVANGDVYAQTGSEQGDTSSLTCSLTDPQLRHLQTMVHNGHVLPQPSQGPSGGHRHPGLQSTQHFLVSSSTKPVGGVFQNFQVSMADSTSVHNKQLSTQLRVTSRPESMGVVMYPPFPEDPCKLQSGAAPVENKPGENVYTIYRTAKSSAQASLVPTLSTMSAFAASTGKPGPPRQELPADDQSPSSSTSLEGPLAKDYSHYNGCAPSPSDTKSLSSEEDLRHPDSPASSELLHYRPRLFNVGDLVWGQIKGFPPWPGKLAATGQGFHPGMQVIQQGKVEPEKLKTLTEDLEALNRATMRNIKGGKLNNHLEAAIQEAMSELDKMSASNELYQEMVLLGFSSKGVQRGEERGCVSTCSVQDKGQQAACRRLRPSHLLLKSGAQSAVTVEEVSSKVRNVSDGTVSSAEGSEVTCVSLPETSVYQVTTSGPSGLS